MSSAKRTTMNLDLNSTEWQRSRTMSLSDLVFDDLMSPTNKASAGNCRSVTSAAMTPTPTQFLFPTSVTAEQEAYASGFARALEEIYRSESQHASQPKMVTSTFSTPSATSSQFITLNNVARFNAVTSPPSYSSATAGVCSNVVWPGSRAADSVRSTPSSYVQPVKNYFSYLPMADCFDSSFVTHPANDALSSMFTPVPSETLTLSMDSHDQHYNWQHVPVPACASSSMTTSAGSRLSLSAAADSTVSGSSPKVDMDEQDQWRLERKRAKNRVAAARCQMRKVERITRLQDKVQELRDNNARLAQTVVELKGHVSTLRKQILMHTERGCRMMIPALS